MHSFALPPATRRNRHAVVAPLFALVLFLSTQGGTLHSIAGSVMTGGDGRIVLENGIATAEASVIDVADDIPTIGRGRALILAEGPVTLAWNDARIMGWAGAFHIAASDALTVSAITSPVLVEKGHARMLVPLGMQWRVPDDFLEMTDSDLGAWVKSRAYLPLPEDFLREQREAANTLEASLAPTVRAPLLSGIDAYLQLPPARERAQQSARAAMLHPLEGALRAGDVPATQAILADPLIKNALADPAGASRTPTLLGIALMQHVPVETTLLPLVLQDERLWLLSSIHPALEGAHWLQGDVDDRSDEARLLRLWMLPLADRNPDAFALPTTDRWGQALSSMFYAQQDPSVRAKLFLRALRDIVAFHRLSQHPERAQRYGRVAHAALEPFASLFSDEEKALLDDLRQDEAYLLEPIPEPDLSAVAPLSGAKADPARPAVAPEERRGEPVISPMHPDEATMRARADLSAAGVMFTAESVLKPDNQAVHISNAVMATPAGDRFYNFTYDVLAHTVGNIADDGAAYPYSLPLERFVEWVKTGE